MLHVYYCESISFKTVMSWAKYDLELNFFSFTLLSIDWNTDMIIWIMLFVAIQSATLSVMWRITFFT